MKSRVSAKLRGQIMLLAKDRCEYCQTSQKIIGPLLEIDHIMPESKGGITSIGNLCAACPHCNSYKSDKTQAIDPSTNFNVPLFNPRIDEWKLHFEWAEQGVILIGKTSIGRATIMTLQINHEKVIAARQLWVTVGWHPPID